MSALLGIVSVLEFLSKSNSGNLDWSKYTEDKARDEIPVTPAYRRFLLDFLKLFINSPDEISFSYIKVNDLGSSNFAP